ncbi:MAG: NAD(P)H-quinone oxidoreductase [Alphaproteobacteria bacterium]
MSLPETMTVVEITEHGGPDVLKPAQRPLPQPGPGDVLIRVASAGVNRPDCLQRAGAYNPPPDASDLPGLEVAGTVVAVGEGVNRWSEGDAVMALTPGGGYAEYCIAPADHCLAAPNGFDMVQAAALPETLFTVYYNVFTRAQLVAGEWFLVHGGSSGIGTIAIQMAKAFGAKVITTAGSADKYDACRGLGADVVVNYRDEDWVAAAKEATGKAGVDVVLDMVGGDYIQKNISVLGMDGRYAFIAFLGGPKAEVNFATIMMKRITMSGSTLRPQTNEQKAAIARNLESHVLPLISAGKIKPVLHTTMPLTEAAAAHALMESSAHIGKIMLTVGD